MRARHIAVGISGGVDSAVAALLLLRAGHRVTGLFMKNWEEDDEGEYCAAADDYRAARAVCETLEIPLQAVNFASEYWDRVFAHFLAEYRAGRTPNPDVLCNREIKFKAFLDYALALGADGIATGHYARVDRDASGFRLLRARDPDKDQSYFLYQLGQRELAHSTFPVGESFKPEVRALAKDAGLPNYARKDSTGICFIGERKFKDFLQRYLPAQPGEIRDLNDRSVGRHEGLMYYTIGQRHGLGIGGEGEAWYVVDKDLARNVLRVTQGHDHPVLFKAELTALDLHWVAGQAPAARFSATAKVRYRQATQACTVNIAEGVAQVRFEAPQRAVTPGQSIVFYADNACLGGGIIA